jgi:phosphoglycerate dehydrogenase-like enzyme
MLEETSRAASRAAAHEEASRRLPRLAFAMRPQRTGNVFAEEDLRRLAGLCKILRAAPLEDFACGEAAETLARTEILVTGWGCPRIDADLLARAPNLRLIAHAAGTVKGMVSPEVFAAGITVINAAAANALPVAEFALAAILFANKRVFAFRDRYRRDRQDGWSSELRDEAIGNFGKTIGIVGASRTGRRLIELLAPFDLDVLLHDPFVEADEAARLGTTWSSLDALVQRSDVVSLHAPSVPATRHMIDGRRLALMKDGATLINTARGAIVDQEALTRELVASRLSAVIDVTEPEILPADSPLYDLPNVLLTPHIAGALGTERNRLGRLVADEVERFVRGESLRFQIDPAELDRQA